MHNSATLEKGFNLEQGSGIFFKKTPRLLGTAGRLKDGLRTEYKDTLLNAFERGGTGKKYAVHIELLQDSKATWY